MLPPITPQKTPSRARSRKPSTNPAQTPSRSTAPTPKPTPRHPAMLPPLETPILGSTSDTLTELFGNNPESVPNPHDAVEEPPKPRTILDRFGRLVEAPLARTRQPTSLPSTVPLPRSSVLPPSTASPVPQSFILSEEGNFVPAPLESPLLVTRTTPDEDGDGEGETERNPRVALEQYKLVGRDIIAAVHMSSSTSSVSAASAASTAVRPSHPATNIPTAQSIPTSGATAAPALAPQPTTAAVATPRSVLSSNAFSPPTRTVAKDTVTKDTRDSKEAVNRSTSVTHSDEPTQMQARPPGQLQSQGSAQMQPQLSSGAFAPINTTTSATAGTHTNTTSTSMKSSNATTGANIVPIAATTAPSVPTAISPSLEQQQPLHQPVSQSSHHSYTDGAPQSSADAPYLSLLPSPSPSTRLLLLSEPLTLTPDLALALAAPPPAPPLSSPWHLALTMHVPPLLLWLRAAAALAAQQARLWSQQAEECRQMVIRERRSANGDGYNSLTRGAWLAMLSREEEEMAAGAVGAICAAGSRRQVKLERRRVGVGVGGVIGVGGEAEWNYAGQNGHSDHHFSQSSRQENQSNGSHAGQMNPEVHGASVRRGARRVEEQVKLPSAAGASVSGSAGMGVGNTATSTSTSTSTSVCPYPTPVPPMPSRLEQLGALMRRDSLLIGAAGHAADLRARHGREGREGGEPGLCVRVRASLAALGEAHRRAGAGAGAYGEAVRHLQAWSEGRDRVCAMLFGNEGRVNNGGLNFGTGASMSTGVGVVVTSDGANVSATEDEAVDRGANADIVAGVAAVSAKPSTSVITATAAAAATGAGTIMNTGAGVAASSNGGAAVSVWSLLDLDIHACSQTTCACANGLLTPLEQLALHAHARVHAPARGISVDDLGSGVSVGMGRGLMKRGIMRGGKNVFSISTGTSTGPSAAALTSLRALAHATAPLLMSSSYPPLAAPELPPLHLLLSRWLYIPPLPLRTPRLDFPPHLAPVAPVLALLASQAPPQRVVTGWAFASRALSLLANTLVQVASHAGKNDQNPDRLIPGIGTGSVTSGLTDNALTAQVLARTALLALTSSSSSTPYSSAPPSTSLSPASSLLPFSTPTSCSLHDLLHALSAAPTLATVASSPLSASALAPSSMPSTLAAAMLCSLIAPPASSSSSLSSHSHGGAFTTPTDASGVHTQTQAQARAQSPSTISILSSPLTHTLYSWASHAHAPPPFPSPPPTSNSTSTSATASLPTSGLLSPTTPVLASPTLTTALTSSNSTCLSNSTSAADPTPLVAAAARYYWDRLHALFDINARAHAHAQSQPTSRATSSHADATGTNTGTSTGAGTGMGTGLNRSGTGMGMSLSSRVAPVAEEDEDTSTMSLMLTTGSPRPNSTVPGHSNFHTSATVTSLPSPTSAGSDMPGVSPALSGGTPTPPSPALDILTPLASPFPLASLSSALSPPVALPRALCPAYGVIDVGGTLTSIYTIHGINPLAPYWAWREIQIPNPEIPLPSLATSPVPIPNKLRYASGPSASSSTSSSTRSLSLRLGSGNSLSTNTHLNAHTSSTTAAGVSMGTNVGMSSTTSTDTGASTGTVVLAGDECVLTALAQHNMWSAAHVHRAQALALSASGKHARQGSSSGNNSSISTSTGGAGAAMGVGSGGAGRYGASSHVLGRGAGVGAADHSHTHTASTSTATATSSSASSAVCPLCPMSLAPCHSPAGLSHDCQRATTFPAVPCALPDCPCVQAHAPSPAALVFALARSLLPRRRAVVVDGPYGAVDAYANNAQYTPLSALSTHNSSIMSSLSSISSTRASAVHGDGLWRERGLGNVSTVARVGDLLCALMQTVAMADDVARIIGTRIRVCASLCVATNGHTTSTITPTHTHATCVCVSRGERGLCFSPLALALSRLLQQRLQAAGTASQRDTHEQHVDYIVKSLSALGLPSLALALAPHIATPATTLSPSSIALLHLAFDIITPSPYAYKRYFELAPPAVGIPFTLSFGPRSFSIVGGDGANTHGNANGRGNTTSTSTSTSHPLATMVEGTDAPFPVFSLCGDGTLAVDRDRANLFLATVWEKEVGKDAFSEMKSMRRSPDTQQPPASSSFSSTTTTSSIGSAPTPTSTSAPALAPAGRLVMPRALALPTHMRMHAHTQARQDSPHEGQAATNTVNNSSNNNASTSTGGSNDGVSHLATKSHTANPTSPFSPAAPSAHTADAEGGASFFAHTNTAMGHDTGPGVGVDMSLDALASSLPSASSATTCSACGSRNSTTADTHWCLQALHDPFLTQLATLFPIPSSPSSRMPLPSTSTTAPALAPLASSSLWRVCVDLRLGDVWVGSGDGPLCCIFGANALIWGPEEAQWQGHLVRTLARYTGPNASTHLASLSPRTGLSRVHSPRPHKTTSTTHTHATTGAAAGATGKGAGVDMSGLCLWAGVSGCSEQILREVWPVAAEEMERQWSMWDERVWGRPLRRIYERWGVLRQREEEEKEEEKKIEEPEEEESETNTSASANTATNTRRLRKQPKRKGRKPKAVSAAVIPPSSPLALSVPSPTPSRSPSPSPTFADPHTPAAAPLIITLPSLYIKTPGTAPPGRHPSIGASAWLWQLPWAPRAGTTAAALLLRHARLIAGDPASTSSSTSPGTSTSTSVSATQAGMATPANASVDALSLRGHSRSASAVSQWRAVAAASTAAQRTGARGDTTTGTSTNAGIGTGGEGDGSRINSPRHALSPRSSPPLSSRLQPASPPFSPIGSRASSPPLGMLSPYSSVLPSILSSLATRLARVASRTQTPLNPLNGSPCLASHLHATSARTPATMCTTAVVWTLRAHVPESPPSYVPCPRTLPCTSTFVIARARHTPTTPQPSLDSISTSTSLPCMCGGTQAPLPLTQTSVRINTGFLPFLCPPTHLSGARALAVQRLDAVYGVLQPLWVRADAGTLLRNDPPSLLARPVCLLSTFGVSTPTPLLLSLLPALTTAPITATIPAPSLPRAPVHRSWSHFPPLALHAARAALVIQRAWRGYRMRAARNAERRTRALAATLIQRAYRAHLARRLKLMNAAATRVQAIWRGYCARKAVRIIREYKLKAHAAHTAARRIQDLVRRAQARKLARVRAVLAREHSAYATTLVTFFQLCLRARLRQRAEMDGYEGRLASGSYGYTHRHGCKLRYRNPAGPSQERVLCTCAQNPLEVQTLTQLRCCLVLLKMLGAVRVRAGLATVDKGVRTMLEQTRQEAVARRGRLLAVLLVQRLWRRAKLRITMRKHAEQARAALSLVRAAIRRMILVARAREKFGERRADVIADVIGAIGFYPNE